MTLAEIEAKTALQESKTKALEAEVGAAWTAYEDAKYAHAKARAELEALADLRARAKKEAR